MTLKLDLRDLERNVGRDLGHSRWRLITQEQVHEFARVTGDHQWMHVDVERATREIGGPIAHGLLIASLMPEMQGEIVEVTGYTGGFSYGFDKLRFTATVKPGQRVRLQQRLKSLESRGDGGRVVNLLSTVEIEGAERPALVADYLGLYYFPQDRAS